MIRSSELKPFLGPDYFGEHIPRGNYIDEAQVKEWVRRGKITQVFYKKINEQLHFQLMVVVDATALEE